MKITLYFIISDLDYYISLPIGLLVSTLDNHQSILNTAARVILLKTVRLYFQPRLYNRIRFTLLPKTRTNSIKIYEMLIKTLDQKTKIVIPERWETNEVSSTIAPAYCLREFLGPWWGGKTQTEPSRRKS